MLFLDVLWMAAAALYLDQIVPGEFGTPRPWNFCCRRDGKSVSSSSSSSESSSDLRSPLAPREAALGDGDDDEWNEAADEFQEAVPAEMRARAAVRIRALRKEFEAVESAKSNDGGAQSVGWSARLKSTIRQLCGYGGGGGSDNEDGQTKAAEPMVAVASLDLTLYAGQITALLGHNGACAHVECLIRF